MPRQGTFTVLRPSDLRLLHPQGWVAADPQQAGLHSTHALTNRRRAGNYTPAAVTVDALSRASSLFPHPRKATSNCAAQPTGRSSTTWQSSIRLLFCFVDFLFSFPEHERPGGCRYLGPLGKEDKFQILHWGLIPQKMGSVFEPVPHSSVSSSANIRSGEGYFCCGRRPHLFTVQSFSYTPSLARQDHLTVPLPAASLDLTPDRDNLLWYPLLASTKTYRPDL